MMTSHILIPNDTRQCVTVSFLSGGRVSHSAASVVFFGDRFPIRGSWHHVPDFTLTGRMTTESRAVLRTPPQNTDH